MTNEELNTALYKKVFAEAFVKERNEALFSLDRKKIEAYMIKYGETEIAQTPDVVFWASVYKAICGIKDAPEAIVSKANLERAGGSAHPTVLYGEAENCHPEFRHPLSCGDLSGLKVCDENRHGTAECCHEGG